MLPHPLNHTPTGALRLAGLVQYVPLPVVGGYLCFVGYFCLAAGGWGGAGVGWVLGARYAGW